MKTITQNKQIGSVVTFVIAGVVLLALTIGGVYLAKQRGMLASTGGNQGSPQKNDTTSGEKPVQKPRNTPTENAQNQPQNTAPRTPTTPEPTVTPRTGGQQQPELPATGTEDYIMASTLAVVAVTYSGLHYFQSRRKVLQQ